MIVMHRQLAMVYVSVAQDAATDRMVYAEPDPDIFYEVITSCDMAMSDFVVRY